MRHILFEYDREAYVDIVDGTDYKETQLEIWLDREQALELLFRLAGEIKYAGELNSCCITLDGCSRVVKRKD
jgi:hypothetical protein